MAVVIHDLCDEKCLTLLLYTKDDNKLTLGSYKTKEFFLDPTPRQAYGYPNESYIPTGELNHEIYHRPF